MPEKYVRREGLPILVRHTGTTTLPENPPNWGAGPVVVCLHDAGLQSSVFLDLLGELGSGAPGAGGPGGALAFDLPGHGRSGSLDALPSIEAMTEMARWVTERCRIEQAILVGHGMGSLIALEWARSQPRSVAGLVLCGVGLALGIENAAIEAMRQVSYGKAPRPFDPSRVARASGQDGMRRAYMEGIQTDPRATLVDLEASRTWSDAFEAREAPTLGRVKIVTGEAESVECRERAERLADFLSSSEASSEASSEERASVERVSLPDAAHFLPLEQPTALASEIRRLQEAA